MTAIGKGDWVECVDDGPGYGAPFPFSRGTVLLVAAMSSHSNGEPAVGISGDLVAGGQRFWRAQRFRPIYRTDKSLTQRLMEPVSERIEVRVGAVKRRELQATAEPRETP